MFEKIFTPIKIRDLVLDSRVVMTAMGTRFTDNHLVNSKHIAYHVARAKGGCTLNMVEVSGVHDGSDAIMFLSLARDEYVPEMKRLVDAIHEVGGKCGIQLYQGGLGVCFDSDAAMLVPDAMSLEDIHEVRIAFGEAARRAVEAGFDLIEVHCAHQYLLHSFLSPAFNHRSDEYGGSFENRAKFPLECLEIVRKNMPDGMPLFIRMNLQDDYVDGLSIEDCIRFCKMAKAIGVDVLNLSRGNMVSAANKFEVPPIDLPHGFNLPMASRVRRETGMITIGVGRINDPYFAEKVLEDDLVDMVAMSRAQLADPELMNKIRDGRINEIDRCCGCNEGCLDGFANLDMPHITCLRNPAVGREAECVITPSDNPRTVLVAGGGMAGMMAARTLRKRGHRVILCEASNRLGGQFILAGSTPHKLDMKKAALEMGEQIVNLGIDVRLNTPVTAELIRQLKSDAVFNCIGSSPIIPSIPGSSLPNVVESHDIIDGKVKVSGKVVIIGGGMVGLETADLLIESGLTPPTVLEMGSAVCVDMGSARKYCMMQTIEDSKIACVTDIKVTEIRENMVIGEKNGEYLEFPCDYAVFAVGSHSRDSHELKEACSELGIDLITVGDAKEARRALEATREAFDAALAF